MLKMNMRDDNRMLSFFPIHRHIRYVPKAHDIIDIASRSFAKTLIWLDQRYIMENTIADVKIREAPRA